MVLRHKDSAIRVQVEVRRFVPTPLPCHLKMHLCAYNATGGTGLIPTENFVALTTYLY